MSLASAGSVGKTSASHEGRTVDLLIFKDDIEGEKGSLCVSNSSFLSNDTYSTVQYIIMIKLRKIRERTVLLPLYGRRCTTVHARYIPRHISLKENWVTKLVALYKNDGSPWWTPPPRGCRPRCCPGRWRSSPPSPLPPPPCSPDIMFRKIEGNGRKFSHIELRNSVIS